MVSISTQTLNSSDKELTAFILALSLKAKS